jgi:hypothetical protein
MRARRKVTLRNQPVIGIDNRENTHVMGVGKLPDGWSLGTGP